MFNCPSSKVLISYKTSITDLLLGDVDILQP